MAQEIERKFLINCPLNHILAFYHLPERFEIEQRYLMKSGDWTIRVRRVMNLDAPRHIEYYLTMKQKISDVSCVELETEINAKFYSEVAARCGPPLHKVRHQITHGDHLWEIDQFSHSVFNGLIVAEIELKHENEQFERPEWLGEEVTHDKRYKNAKMVRRLM